MGKQKVVDKGFPEGITPQQAGYTPIISLGRGEGRFLLGYFRGVPAFIDLDKLVVQPLVLAEKAYSVDKVDSRNGVKVTIEDDAEVGDIATGAIEVPAGEVWYLNRLAVTCPAADADGSASFNILVSPWPKTAAGGDKGYYATAQTAMGAATIIDLPTLGQLGEELRLVGGDKLTLQLTVTVAFTVDKDFTLVPYGRKGKALVS